MVMYGGWPAHQSSFTRARVLEYTNEQVIAEHKGTAGIDFQKLLHYPCLFMPEQNSGDNLARIGQIIHFNLSAQEIILEYSFDPEITPVSVDRIADISGELQIGDWEFSRTHWAVKDVDLYRVFLRSLTPSKNRPTVFNISDTPAVDPQQMSAMMPFDARFTEVYHAIQRAGSKVGMKVNRADDIWVHHQIIQDIVSLIDHSRVVVVDCTDRNPNVFYEAGIAHTLGREVIMITQHIDNVPFDLRHLRAITYLNNNEGLEALEKAVTDRVQTLLAR